jgi:hypothetical protein
LNVVFFFSFFFVLLLSVVLFLLLIVSILYLLLLWLAFSGFILAFVVFSRGRKRATGFCILLQKMRFN